MSYLSDASPVFTISVGSIPAQERIEVKVVVSDLEAVQSAIITHLETVCDDPAE